jgi:signal transduction histidine kinase
MAEFFDDLLGAGYAPHGYCLLWRPWLIWTHVVSDALIACAYFSIPFILLIFVRRRTDLIFKGVFVLFAIFIFACGSTHLMNIWNLWHGDYALEAAIKAITAAASLSTAVILAFLLPKAIGLPSHAQLQEVNDALRAEIVERQKAEAALLHSRKLEAVGQLTGGLAHDFNNLLQVIEGSVELIATETEDSRHRKLARTARQSVDRGRKLTGQLLSFSRVQNLTLRPIDVLGLLGGIEDLLRRPLPPSIDFVLEADDAIPAAIADSSQLEMAMLNLVLNARDAMPAAGRLAVTLTQRRLAGRDDVPDDVYVAISVSDSGQGIAAEAVDRVFDPFFSTKPVGQGSGLGLSMVFGMARQSGGTAIVESTPGVGASFTIFLRRAQEMAAPAPEAEESIADLAKRIKGANLLVVDDDEAVRDTLAMMLRSLGCVVDEAESGEEALRILERKQPELVLLDYAMPRMTGAEVARRITTRWPDIAIVFVTGFARSGAIDAAMGGRARVLYKPISTRDLTRTLAAALGDRLA